MSASIGDPQGYFHNETDWGWDYFLPLSGLENYWTDLQIGNGVRLTWKMYWRKTNVVDFEVTHDVTGQAKVKMFDDLPCLVLPRSITPSNGKGQQINMDGL